MPNNTTRSLSALLPTLLLLAACGTPPASSTTSTIADPTTPPRAEKVETPPQPKAPEAHAEPTPKAALPIFRRETTKVFPPPIPKPMPDVEGTKPGEGEWAPLADGMVKTVMRNRKYKGKKKLLVPKKDYPITIAVWDPEVLALHTVGGTKEPEPDKGKTKGSGLIPNVKDDAVRRELVAAFNGGWRTADAEASGMMVDGVTIRSAKANRATIAFFEDGHLEMGTWGSGPAPEGVHTFRQNIEPVYDAKAGGFNPMKREGRWGGTGGVGGADGQYTARSAICRTTTGLMAYIFGRHIHFEQLGQVMERLSCDYGMHLDMNGIHVGFEVYKVSPKAKRRVRPKVLPLDATKLTKDMGYAPFPRYLGKNIKDFFYLTRRATLPEKFNIFALQPLDAPGSERRAPAARIGAHASEPYHLIVVDTKRFKAKPGAQHGGLKIVVTQGASPGDKTLTVGNLTLQGAPLETPGKAGVSVVLAGKRGDDLVLIHANEGLPLAARKESLKATGCDLSSAIALGDGSSAHALVRDTKDEAWLLFDGRGEEGKVAKDPLEATEGTILFHLPKESHAAARLTPPASKKGATP